MYASAWTPMSMPCVANYSHRLFQVNCREEWGYLQALSEAAALVIGMLHCATTWSLQRGSDAANTKGYHQ